MKIHKSIIDEKILCDFSEIRGRTLMNHVANSYNIEAAIAFADLFCPEIIEAGGCIFISEFYNDNYKKENGTEALESLFEKSSFNYTDPFRKSAV